MGASISTDRGPRPGDDQTGEPMAAGSPDSWSLYALMLKSRLFEQVTALLWRDGLISGEMHMGTGEEAIIAGVISQLREGDAMALDHRGTAAMLMRDVDPVSLLRELLGFPDGLSGGQGGHMHLFSREPLAASSGIVGSSGPAAAGYALAAQRLHPGAIAVAFFGEGAMNQGMLLESLNLATAWNLPVLFVCKDDGWSITTPSETVTGGDLNARARSFGMPAIEVDGREVSAVWEAARRALARARAGEGPTFLHARCVHLDAHLLGFQLTRMAADPLREMPKTASGLTRALLRRGGAAPADRVAGLRQVLGAVSAVRRDPRREASNDPLRRAREPLLADAARLRILEERIEREMGDILARAAEAEGEGAS